MIKITDKYYINATSNCYILQEKKINQDENSKEYGKEKFENLKYYTQIEDCIRGILKLEIRKFISKTEENTLKELMEYVRKQDDFLKSLKLEI